MNNFKSGVLTTLGVAAAIALFFLGKSCERNATIKKAGKIDTVYITQTYPKIVSVPKPYAVIKTVLKPYAVIVDTSIVRDVIPADSSCYCEGWDYTYLYGHSERVGPGVVSIFDTIQRSQILGRGLSYLADSVPVITKTVILTQPKKTILYFGASAFGNRNLNFGAGVDLSLKWKNDKQYGVGILYTNQIYYGVSYRIPLKLKGKN